MNREEAQAAIRGLSPGLEADVAGVRRLLERISAREDAEVLRAYLIESGAQAVLDVNR